MRTVNFEISLGESELSYMRRHLADRMYLERTLSPSEPRILFFSHGLGKSRRLFNAEPGAWAEKLLDLDTRITELEDLQGRARVKQEKDIRRDMKYLPHERRSDFFGRVQDGDAFELPTDDPDLKDLLSLFYIRLPWNNVRLQAHDGERKRGYFICFGWSPISNELYYAGPDFVPYRTEEEIVERLAKIPEGRGLPDDVLQTLANCGPSSLAAYLNKSCKDVIQRAYSWQQSRWISINPMLELFDEYRKPHKSIKTTDEPELPSEAFGDRPAGLAFIQFVGPDGKYSGWRGWSQEYSHTHWIAYDAGLIYDFNARHEDGTLGDWISEETWIQNIVPTLMPEKGTGHYVRNILIPKR